MLMNTKTPHNLNTADPHARREYLRELCGIAESLKHREEVELGTIPLHLEIYASTPTDPVVIFIPGIGTYSEIFSDFLHQFSEAGFNVIALDLRGHGHSGGDRGLYTVEEVIADIGQVIDYAETRFHGPLCLWGNSIGAPLALAAAEQNSKVKAVICHTLFTAVLPPNGVYWQSWQTLKMLRHVIPTQTIDFKQFLDIESLLEGTPMLPYLEHDDLMVWDYPLQTLASVYNYKHESVYKKFPFNLAILTGEKDDVLELRYQKELVKFFTQPADLLIVPEAGHMLPFKNINETITLSKDWLLASLQQTSTPL